LPVTGEGIRRRRLSHGGPGGTESPGDIIAARATMPVASSNDSRNLAFRAPDDISGIDLKRFHSGAENVTS
jgi:hypothetical protein